MLLYQKKWKLHWIETFDTFFQVLNYLSNQHFLLPLITVQIIPKQIKLCNMFSLPENKLRGKKMVSLTDWQNCQVFIKYLQIHTKILLLVIYNFITTWNMQWLRAECSVQEPNRCPCPPLHWGSQRFTFIPFLLLIYISELQKTIYSL